MFRLLQLPECPDAGLCSWISLSGSWAVISFSGSLSSEKRNGKGRDFKSWKIRSNDVYFSDITPVASVDPIPLFVHEFKEGNNNSSFGAQSKKIESYNIHSSSIYNPKKGTRLTLKSVLLNDGKRLFFRYQRHTLKVTPLLATPDFRCKGIRHCGCKSSMLLWL